MSEKSLPHIIGTGLNGLVGSKVVTNLESRFIFENIDINHPTNPVDITNINQLEHSIGSSSADVVLHCAAFTDVTAAWQQSGNVNGLAYTINVVGTENIVAACKKYNKYLIHLSTAYVFDGAQSIPYTEADRPKPIEWYGQTKYLAEQTITEKSDHWSILRIDQPFRSDTHAKVDIVHRILTKLVDGTLPPQFTDHTFGPTFIDDLALTIGWFATTETQGLFHATNGEQWSDYAFASKIAEILKGHHQVTPGSLQSYLKQTQRPYQANTALDISKLKKVIPHALTAISDALQVTIGK